MAHPPQYPANVERQQNNEQQDGFPQTNVPPSDLQSCSAETQHPC